MRRQIIVIDLPVKVSANAFYAGMHWGKRKRIADEYHKALIEHRNGRWHTPLHLNFVFTFRGKMLDVSNCFAMAKMLEDAMVLNNIIPNDDPLVVESVSIRVMSGKKDTVSIYA